MDLLFCLLLLIEAVSSYCPDGYTYYTSTQKCYKVVEDPATYFSAADACTLDDGQLVSIHNAFENTYVTNLIENKYADHWIGLTSMISGWNYTWLDNTAFNYDRFSPSPPNHNFNCVAIKPVPTTWTTESCSNQLPFVCIFDPAVNRNCPVCPTHPPCPVCPPPPVCNPTVYSAGDSAPPDFGSTIMERGLFKALNSDLPCPSGYTYLDKTQRCYKVVDDGSKTFFAASNACNLDDAELVSIHSLEESQQIGALLSNADKTYWIGLTNLIDSWNQWTWLDDTSVRYSNWIDGKPDTNMSCTVIHSLGYQWATENCQLLLPYICEFDPTKTHNCPPCPTPQPCPVCPTYKPCPIPKCDAGWKYSDDSGFCYFLGNERNVTNTEAENLCRNQGAYLASFHNPTENSFIVNYIYATGKINNAWIGLYRTGPGKTDFANFDGTPVNYTNWVSGQPDNYGSTEYCSEMCMGVNFPASPWCANYPVGIWNDTDCNRLHALYVCKKPANK